MATSAGSDPKPNRNTSDVEEDSPDNLFLVSQKHLLEGNIAKAEAVLKMALSKDPECINGLMSMSTLLMQKGQFGEALEFLERIISKPFTEHPLLFATARLGALQLAAACCVNQGKPFEGIGYLEPLASMKVPEHPIAKDNYYEGIAMLAGISFDVGRKDDAAKYEKIFFAKDPAGYARRIPHLPPRYGEFVKSLKYV